MKNFFLAIITAFLGVLSVAFTQHRSNDQPFKQAFLDRINAVRQNGCKCGITYMPPAPPLAWNTELEQAAQAHAEDMYKRNYFSHISKNGLTPQDRIIKAGYTFKGYKSFAAGENIAQGQQQIDEVMTGWIKSEGHCKNLMNPAFKEVGVAVDHDYWVQDFGGREPFSAEEQKMINSGQYKLLPGKTSSN
jgi:uncharacterized protein YkwD